MADITVTTPWYPRPDRPYNGSFVAAQVRALLDLGYSVDVVQVHELSMKPGRAKFDDLRPRWRDWLREQGSRWGPRDDPDAPGARFCRLPSPRLPGKSRISRARLHKDALTVAAELFGGWSPIVHAHVGIPTGWATAEAAPPGTPLFVTEHYSGTPQLLEKRRLRRLYREMLLRSDAIIPVSEELSAVLKERYDDLDTTQDLIHPIPNVVDLLDQESNLDGRDLNKWIAVGGLSTRKRPDLTVDSFREYRRSNPSAELTLVGDGPLREELENMTREEPWISVLGPRTPAETLGIIAEQDVLLLLSTRETFGMVVAEAAGLGVAVVATASGGPEGILDDELGPRIGTVLPIECTPPSVAAAVAELGQRDLDRKAAAEIVARRYGPFQVAHQLDQLYQQALGS